MWPHSITVGLNGRAISIGTDGPEVIASLDRWRIDDVGEPVDYCLELHPETPGPGKPRPLPGLYHGSTALVRTTDTARLTTAFLRVLGAYARPAGDGQVRLGLTPVVRNGVALLVPPTTVATVPDRWLTAQGIEALYTISSLVDAHRGNVLVDPPLGSDEEPTARAFGGWWLPPSGWDDPLTPGFAVAEVMPLVIDVTADNATSTLRAVAALVERAHPAFAPNTIDAVKDSLVSGLVTAGSQ